MAELGVARCLGLEGTQRLDVVELEAESTELQLDVQREAAVPGGQDEPVAPSQCTSPGSWRIVR
jgi:hypothetical protein